LVSTDSEILVRLRNGDKEVLAKVYSLYRAEFIQWLMARYSSDLDEARDIYQQTIVILYENVISGRLTRLTSTLKTYLFSIGKNKFKEGRKSAKRLPVMEEIIEDKALSEQRLTLIEKCLSQLGEPCRSLLIQFYYHNNSVDQLCGQFGYKNVSSAKNQKYKCMERLRKMVMELATVKGEAV
jgi:RNA polymerase sigma-70 factor (ECF subfamily)